MNKSYIIKSEKGKFKLEISKFINRNSGHIESYGINLGGPENKCIQIKVPGKSNQIQIGKLIWVESESSCYYELFNKKNITQHMVNIGFSIARSLNPNCTRYEFDDCSRIKCILPNNKEEYVSLKLFYIAFHGKTWYEEMFGAKLQHNYELYRELILHFYDSAKKPKIFDFKNETLNTILMPIFESCSTWHVFFQKIDKEFKEKKCSIVYPWIYSAMIHIFDNNMIFDNPNWYIDFNENIQNYKTPLIPFTLAKQGGSFTRKRMPKLWKYQLHAGYFIHYPTVSNLDYQAYLNDSNK